MTKTLEMVFKNSVGKEVVLRLADPKANLTLAETAAVMQTIVDKNIFQFPAGNLTEVVTARINSKDTVELV
jgi:hypothetical protein